MISERGRCCLWAGAVALCAVPPVYGRVASLFDATEHMTVQGIAIGIVGGMCRGWELYSQIRWETPVLRTLLDHPVLVAAAAFAVWAVTSRHSGGETRVGRAAGWAALVFLAAAALFVPLAMAYDGAHASECRRVWEPFGGRTRDRELYWLLPATVLLLALWRAWHTRLLTRGALLAGLLAVLHGDSWTGRAITSDREACARMQMPRPAEHESPAQAVSRMPWPARRLAFLCSARGYVPRLPGTSPPYHPERADRDGGERDERSDAYLLSIGRDLCRNTFTPIRRMTPDQLSVWQGPRSGAGADGYMPLLYLCPDETARRIPLLGMSARRLKEQRRVAMARIAKEQAREEAVCKARGTYGTYPGPRPRHQSAARLGTSEGGGFLILGGEPARPEDSLALLGTAARNGLAAASGGTAAVTTAENTGICVSVRAYTKAPPLSRAGWDRVAEIGLTVTGRTVKVVGLDGDKGPSVPVAEGPGAYRVRVHVRGRDVTERYLIALFPAR